MVKRVRTGNGKRIPWVAVVGWRDVRTAGGSQQQGVGVYLHGRVCLRLMMKGAVYDLKG